MLDEAPELIGRVRVEGSDVHSGVSDRLGDVGVVETQDARSTIRLIRGELGGR